jgi:hypothetical protein
MKYPGSWPLFFGVLLLITVSGFGYWHFDLGPYDFLVFLVLGFFFIILACVAFIQIIFIIYERSKDKGRVITTMSLIFCLALIYLYPNGLIIQPGSDVNVLFRAYREGAANCTTTLTLREDGTFTETDICFGSSYVEGRYEVRNDTIFFSDVQLGRGVIEYYDHAVIQRDVGSGGSMGEITRYKNDGSTMASLWITKNDLP